MMKGNEFRNQTQTTIKNELAEWSDNSNNSQVDYASNAPSGDHVLVDWDGPNDPKNPKNWPHSAFLIHTILVSMLCLAG